MVGFRPTRVTSTKRFDPQRMIVNVKAPPQEAEVKDGTTVAIDVEGGPVVEIGADGVVPMISILEHANKVLKVRVGTLERIRGNDRNGILETTLMGLGLRTRVCLEDSPY